MFCVSVILVIQNFFCDIDGAVFALFKGSAHIFSDDADAEQLHAAQQQNQHDDGGVAGNVYALNEYADARTLPGKAITTAEIAKF